MQKAYQIVSDQLKVTFDRAKRRYDQRVHAVHFPLNSYVWYFCPRLTAGRGRKFRKLTDGPFRVLRILNDVNYVIQKVPGSRLIVCHVDRLIRFERDPPAVWVRYDGEKDQGPSVQSIQKIVRKSGLRFGTLRPCSVFSIRRADPKSDLQRLIGRDTALQQVTDRSQGRGPRPNRQAMTALPTTQAAGGSVTFNMRPMACIASQHAAPIKGEEIDKLIISIPDIEASRSLNIMTAKSKPKSKGSISDSEDFELGDDGGVAVGFSETTVGLEESEGATAVEGTDPALESLSPVADPQSPSATTMDLNKKIVKDPKQDPPDSVVLTKKVPDSSKQPDLTKKLLHLKSGESDMKTKETKTTVVTKPTTGDSHFKSPKPVDKTNKKNKVVSPCSDAGLTSGLTKGTADLAKVPDSSDSSKICGPVLAHSSKGPDVEDSPVTKDKTDSTQTQERPIIDGRPSTSESDSGTRDPQKTVSTDEDSDETSKSKGPNIKYTKRKSKDLPKAVHVWPMARTPNQNFGPWTCQLCSAGPFATASGTRRHYRNHYRKWDSVTDVCFDMTESERDQVRLTKSLKSATQLFPSATMTGAQPVLPKSDQKRTSRPTKDLPAALGGPPGSEPGKSVPGVPYTSNLTDTRTVVLDHDESDSPGPTIRRPTRPVKPACGLRDSDRNKIIESPIKIKINVRKRDCPPPESMDRMDTSSELESEGGSVSQNEEIIYIDDEPKIKCKNEFLTFEQIEDNPDEDTVTNLLIYGLDATVEAAKKKDLATNDQAARDQSPKNLSDSDDCRTDRTSDR